jgi:hypothetical protein
MIRPSLLRTALAAALTAAFTAAFTGTLLVSATAASALPAWEDHASSWQAGAHRQARVIDLRFAAHESFDRAVIDLRRADPRGSARHLRHFVYEGSGEKVPIGGRSGLSMNLVSAAGHTFTGRNVYAGPRIARPHLETLKALAITGDWEGQVTVGFALTHRADYRIFWLSQPRRLVIDFRHE